MGIGSWDGTGDGQTSCFSAQASGILALTEPCTHNQLIGCQCQNHHKRKKRKMTPEKAELIAEMWEKSRSSGEIAKKLEITRGSVMGVIHRFKEKGVVFHRPARKMVSVEHPPIEVKPMTKPPMPIKSQINVHHEPAPDAGITIFELTSRSCRYILGPVNGDNTRYCGEPKVSTAYCKQHKALCYYTLNPKLDASHDIGDTKWIGDGATRAAS